MIKTIQGGTSGAVKAMEAGSRQVEEGVTSTARAGQSLKQIIQMSEEVGSMIAHIATAATQQSGATVEINQNMEQITELVKESATSAQQSAKACQDLSELAMGLQNMVDSFKVAADKRQFVESSRPGSDDLPSRPSAKARQKAFAAGAH